MRTSGMRDVGTPAEHAGDRPMPLERRIRAVLRTRHGHGPGRRRHGRLGPLSLFMRPADSCSRDPQYSVDSPESTATGRCPTCRLRPILAEGPSHGRSGLPGPGTVRARSRVRHWHPHDLSTGWNLAILPASQGGMLVSVSSDIDGVGREAAQQCTLSPAALSLARFTAMPCTALLHVALACVHAPHARRPRSQTRPPTHARAQDGDRVRMPSPPDHERVRARDRADPRAWRGRRAQRFRDSRRGLSVLGLRAREASDGHAAVARNRHPRAALPFPPCCRTAPASRRTRFSACSR